MKRFCAIAMLIICGVVVTGYLWWERIAPTLSRADLVLKKVGLTNPVAEEQDIYEAVFRYRMAQTGDKGTCFLSINGGDPSDDFLARFRDYKSLTAKKASGIYVDRQFPHTLRDKVTGEATGVLFVGQLRWIPPDKAEVLGGSQCGGLCLNSGIYRVAKKNGRWIVESYEIRWIA